MAWKRRGIGGWLYGVCIWKIKILVFTFVDGNVSLWKKEMNFEGVGQPQLYLISYVHDQHPKSHVSRILSIIS